jgi:hypothetical protein
MSLVELLHFFQVEVSVRLVDYEGRRKNRMETVSAGDYRRNRLACTRLPEAF